MLYLWLADWMMSWLSHWYSYWHFSLCSDSVTVKCSGHMTSHSQWNTRWVTYMHFDILYHILTSTPLFSHSIQCHPNFHILLYSHRHHHSKSSYPIPPIPSSIPIGGGSETYYSLSDLIFNLMFEDEEDALEFLAHCGFAVSELAILVWTKESSICVSVPQSD